MKDYKFSNTWFQGHIPVWKEYILPHCQRDIKALEIGSYEGQSACWMLENLLTYPDSRLICVDCHFKPPFNENIAESGGAHRVDVIPGFSWQVLPSLKFNFKPMADYFDLVYIDGGHRPEIVLIDAVNSWLLTKPGGLIVFDDYGWAHESNPGPKVAIDAFCSIYPVKVVYKGYQVIVKRTEGPHQLGS